MKKYSLLLVITLLSLRGLNAQNDGREKLGAWYIIASNSKISEKFDFQLQSQFRFYEPTSELQQFKIRTGATYALTNTIKFGLGYAYFLNDPSYLSDIPKNFNEHRIFLAAHIINTFSKLTLQHRYWYEHRFFEDGIDSSGWMRYMLKATYPISMKVTIDVYDEIFINVQGTNNFSQNWMGAGISYKISDLIGTRVGFQHIQTSNSNFSRLLVGLTFKPNFNNIDL